MTLSRIILSLACPLLFSVSACSSVLPKPPEEGKATGKIEQKARVVGWDGEFLALGYVIGDAGDSIEVQWSSAKGKAKKSEVSPVLPAAQIKAGQRVIAAASASSRSVLIGTVLAVNSPERLRVKWDLDEREEEIPSDNVALLSRPLCDLKRGCKHGVGKEPGSSAESAAAIPGVKVGSRLAVKYEYKKVEYWAPGEVLEILDDGFNVNVSGQGHLKVTMADLRAPVKPADLKKGLPVQHGTPPNGLVPGYVVGVEGDMVLVSSSEDGSMPVKKKIGEEVFHAP